MQAMSPLHNCLQAASPPEKLLLKYSLRMRALLASVHGPRLPSKVYVIGAAGGIGGIGGAGESGEDAFEEDGGGEAASEEDGGGGGSPRTSVPPALTTTRPPDSTCTVAGCGACEETRTKKASILYGAPREESCVSLEQQRGRIAVALC